MYFPLECSIIKFNPSDGRDYANLHIELEKNEKLRPLAEKVVQEFRKETNNPLKLIFHPFERGYIIKPPYLKEAHYRVYEIIDKRKDLIFQIQNNADIHELGSWLEILMSPKMPLDVNVFLKRFMESQLKTKKESCKI